MFCTPTLLTYKKIPTWFSKCPISRKYRRAGCKGSKLPAGKKTPNKSKLGMLPDKVLVSIETYGCFIDFVTHSSANGDVNSLKTAPFARYTLSEQSSLTQSRARETGTHSFISLGVNFLFGYRQPPRRRVANPGCWREG